MGDGVKLDALSTYLLDNMGLVYQMVDRYYDFARQVGVDKPEMISLAMQSLLYAKQHNNPAIAKMTTFAFRCYFTRLAKVNARRRAMKRRAKTVSLDCAYDLAAPAEPCHLDAKELVRQALLPLTHRQQTVLIRALMLDEPYDAIGVALGVSGERVRQILHAALATCRETLGVAPGVIYRHPHGQHTKTGGSYDAAC